MSFQNKNMSVIAYANGFTLWHYATGNDTIADITASNYFAPAASMINNGDIVIVSGADGAGTIRTMRFEGGNLTANVLQ